MQGYDGEGGSGEVSAVTSLGNDPAVPPKRAAILRAGRTLLLRQGIRKTRIEEVCTDARVSKRTFYKYFRDKDELAIAVLAEIFETNRGRLEAVLAGDRPMAEKARQIMEVKAALATETSATFYRESLDESTAPGRFVLQERQQWDLRIRRFYAESQAQGVIRKEIDLDLLMVIMTRCRDLVDDPDLGRIEPDLARRAEAVMRLFFHGIVSPEGGLR